MSQCQWYECNAEAVTTQTWSGYSVLVCSVHAIVTVLDAVHPDRRLVMPEPERCTAAVDTLTAGIVECHGYRRNHPPPHRHVHDDDKGRALIEWYDDRPGYGVTPLRKPGDYMTEAGG